MPALRSLPKVDQHTQVLVSLPCPIEGAREEQFKVLIDRLTDIRGAKAKTTEWQTTRWILYLFLAPRDCAPTAGAESWATSAGGISNQRCLPRMEDFGQLEVLIYPGSASILKARDDMNGQTSPWIGMTAMGQSLSIWLTLVTSDLPRQPDFPMTVGRSQAGQ